MSLRGLLFVCAMLASAARADEAPRARRTPPPLRPKTPLEEKTEIFDASPVRARRPVSFLASGVGKTPFFGALVDVNLHPNIALGAGFGYFSADSLSGNFIPVYAAVYALQSNFSPFIEGGVDFITVKIQSGNSLLNSTFRGTQFIVGAGLEYRFDFGLVARLDAVRFINAKVWSPGLAIGYSMVVF